MADTAVDGSVRVRDTAGVTKTNSTTQKGEATPAAPPPASSSTSSASRTSLSSPPSPRSPRSPRSPASIALSSPPSSNQFVWLGLARCIWRASNVLIESCSQELLIRELFRGDAVATQLFLSSISSGLQLVDFYTGPLRTALIDHYGRRFGMTLPTLALAALRISYTASPSRARYLAYRVGAALMAVWFTSYQAALADLLDPASERYVETTQTMDQCATITSMVTLLAVRQIAALRDPRLGMYIASGLAVAAAGTVAATTSETLPGAMRGKPFPVDRLKKSLANPLAPMASYFTASSEITKYHALRTSWIAIAIGSFSVLGLYRRQVRRSCTSHCVVHIALCCVHVPYGSV